MCACICFTGPSQLYERLLRLGRFLSGQHYICRHLSVQLNEYHHRRRFCLQSSQKRFQCVLFHASFIVCRMRRHRYFLRSFRHTEPRRIRSVLKKHRHRTSGSGFSISTSVLGSDLNEQVTSFRDLIRQYTNMFSDSCTASQNLLKMTGAQQFLEKSAFEARSYLRSTGIVSDESEANAKTRTDGSAVVSNAPAQKDSGGSVIDAPELNLTWALLSGGSFSTKIQPRT